MRIQLRDIHKHFGAVHANRGVNLEIAPGTIHGILGENGAGKSTLMKILSGFLSKTSGAIVVEGKEREFRQPSDATRLGIGMLYQDPMDFPRLTVLENFLLRRDGRSALRPGLARGQLMALARKFGFHVDPDRQLERLTLGERQQLELLRLLTLQVRVLILDEPTTGISAVQKEILFHALRQLARDGASILLVSHKLEDVEALCDRVTVLRKGEVTGEETRPFDTRHLLELMFGTPPAPPRRCVVRAGGPVLTFRGVSAPGGRAGLHECSVTIRQGEVVGLAGVEGSGQNVFLRVAAGLRAPHRGEVEFRGHRLRGYEHHAQKKGGVTFLPTSRLEEGLIEGLSLREHFALNQDPIPFLVPWDRADRDAERGIRRFRIQGQRRDMVESLSGGNQQRLLLSFIPPEPTLLLLENPTRGLDVESANAVWRELLRYGETGTTIVFSSAELDEILAVADRVLVFYDGFLVHDTRTGETTAAELGRAIAGKAA